MNCIYNIYFLEWIIPFMTVYLDIAILDSMILEVFFLEPFSVLTFSRYPVMFVMSEKYVTCRNIMHEFRR